MASTNDVAVLKDAWCCVSHNLKNKLYNWIVTAMYSLFESLHIIINNCLTTALPFLCLSYLKMRLKQPHRYFYIVITFLLFFLSSAYTVVLLYLI